MRALGNILHECAHHIFARTSKRNQFFGHLLSILLFECFDTYKKEHILHHRFLGDSLKDPDYIRYKKIKLNIFQNNLWNIFLSVIYPYHWYLSLKNSVFIFAKNDTIKKIKIFYLLLLLVSIYFWPKFIFLYLFVPYVSTYQVFKLFSDIIDHDNVYESENKKDRARNHIFRFSFLNWIVFPRNDAYHLVHHLHPNVPTAQYKTKHELLLKKNFSYALKNHSCDLQKRLHSGIQR